MQLRLCSIVVLLCFMAVAPVSAQRHPDELQFPELSLNPPEPERHTLKNGMVIYLLEDHELPLFSISAIFHVGDICDPADKAGLASLVGTVMRTGGTTEKTGDQLDEELEFIAGSVETSIGKDQGMVSLEVLQKDIEQGLAVFADVMRNPAFRQEKIDLARNQMLESIRRRNDGPDGIARREFIRHLYGKDHPIARISTTASLNAITREDMIRFHQQYFQPNNAILAVAGDFETRAMLRKLESLFSDWKKQAVTLPRMPDVQAPEKTSVYLAVKDINQTNVLLGHLGIRRHNPDYFAIQVMNQILSFQRLFFRVRTDAGLAYSVGSSFGLGPDIGTFAASMQTRADATVRAIRLVKTTIEDMRVNLVEEEELRIAKESYLNSFVFNFDSMSEIVSRRAVFEFQGYPPDFLKTYRDKIAAVIREDIRRVAQKYITPDQAILMVVGNPEAFDESLDTFGPVQEIDLEEALQ